MKKFKNDKLELKGLITGGGWVKTNAGCNDPDLENTATGEVIYLPGEIDDWGETLNG